MIKGDLDTLSFEEVRTNFLNGAYEADWDEHHDAMNVLHNKMPSIESLIPLLESGNRNCQYTAAFIAAQEGINASPIFKYIFKLIKSEWAEVRDEACDCFLNCTENPEHYLALLSLLDDEEQAIRLRVITIMFGLDKTIIEGIYRLTTGDSSLVNVNEGMAILLKIKDKEVATRKNTESKLSKVITICAYISAYKKYGDTEKFKMASKELLDEDIAAHLDIYFEDD